MTLAEEVSGGRGESRADSSCCLRPQRRCRSNPNFSEWSSRRRNRVFEGERDFRKVKRSLRLLGLELSEFGIPEGGEDGGPGGRSRRKERSPSICTRIVDRSVSLECVRAAVRRAWLEDELGESHRRLLARAAYEEWYFTKERESWMKREEERRARLRMKMNLEDDYQKKKARSEEEFQKWLTRKRQKERRQEMNVPEKKEERLTTKTKEDSEKAFLKWKKNKDKELEKKRMEKRIEEEKKIESEKQKKEKKFIAEKAYEKWKFKLDESKRSEHGKRERSKRKLKEEERRRREEESKISFQMWKTLKDKEIKQNIRQLREAERTAREQRLIQMEERTYEAEQAFENWLERIDSRKQKPFYCIDTYHKSIPWIPT